MQWGTRVAEQTLPTALREGYRRGLLRFVGLGRGDLVFDCLDNLLRLFLQVGEKIVRPFLEQNDKGERREEEEGEPEEFSEHCHAGDFSLGGGGVNRAVLKIS